MKRIIALVGVAVALTSGCQMQSVPGPLNNLPKVHTPANRGPQVDVPEPDLGRCFVSNTDGSGTTEYGFQSCHRDSWNGPIQITTEDGTIYEYVQVCLFNQFGGVDCQEAD